MVAMGSNDIERDACVPDTTPFAQRLNKALCGNLVAIGILDTGGDADVDQLITLVLSRVPELRAYTLGVGRPHNESYCKSLATVLAAMAVTVAFQEEAATYDTSHELHAGLAIPGS